jgi:uncharacterized protein
MSGYIKGYRKTKTRPMVRFMGKSMRPEVLIASMLVALYVVLLAGSIFQGGTDGFLLECFSFVMFAIMSYMMRTSLRQMSAFVMVSDALLALSALPLVWGLLTMTGAISATTFTGLEGLAEGNVLHAVIAIAIVIGVVYVEKDRLPGIFVKAGNLSEGLKIGLTGLFGCLLLTLVGLFASLGSVSADAWKIIPVIGFLLIFCLASGFSEEFLFRGLLLSRLAPVTGKKFATLIQAVAFGVFQLSVAMALTTSIETLVAVLIASIVLGFYWAQVTLKNGSILGSSLFHAGIDMLIAMPVFIVFLV